MIRTASVAHGKDGYSLYVWDVPAWAYFLEWADGVICSVSRGYLCAVCLPAHWGWLFRIGWGHDKPGDPWYDPDSDLLKHSLGGLVFHIGQEMGRFTWKRRVEVYKRPLTFDEVCEHFPDSRSEDDDDGADYVRGVLVS